MTNVKKENFKTKITMLNIFQYFEDNFHYNIETR